MVVSRGLGWKCWGSNSGPLREQDTLLTTAPKVSSPKSKVFLSCSQQTFKLNSQTPNPLQVIEKAVHGLAFNTQALNYKIRPHKFQSLVWANVITVYSSLAQMHTKPLQIARSLITPLNIINADSLLLIMTRLALGQ